MSARLSCTWPGTLPAGTEPHSAVTETGGIPVPPPMPKLDVLSDTVMAEPAGICRLTLRSANRTPNAVTGLLPPVTCSTVPWARPPTGTGGSQANRAPALRGSARRSATASAKPACWPSGTGAARNR